MRGRLASRRVLLAVLMCATVLPGQEGKEGQKEKGRQEPKETQGFHNVLVTEDYHPWIEHWWPHGHIIGWEHTFVHELTHLLDCIVNDKDVAPYGATFEDGYRTAVVCDAIADSAAAKKQVDPNY